VYVDERIAEAVASVRPAEVPEVPQVPQGPLRRVQVPPYPDDPKKDARYNLHIPAGELWEIKATAAALGLDPSRLLRHLWQTFRSTIEAKQALQRALPQGTPGTPPDTGGADEEA
jgi:hypothetical protein